MEKIHNFFYYRNNGSFSLELITNGTAGKLPELKKQSSAFLDLNGDMTAGKTYFISSNDCF